MKLADTADLRSASGNGVWVRVPEVVFESIVLSFELFGCTFVYEKDYIVLLSPPIFLAL